MIGENDPWLNRRDDQIVEEEQPHGEEPEWGKKLIDSMIDSFIHSFIDDICHLILLFSLF